MFTKTSSAAALLASLFALSEASPRPHDAYETSNFYVSYVATFNKQYDSIHEFRYRMNLFAQTQELIRHHNIKKDISFILGNNQFSDMTD